MKFVAAIFAFVLASVGFLGDAYGAATAATPVYVNMVSAPVGTSDWYPVLTSTPKIVKGVSIFNTNPDDFEIGIANAGAAANAEVAQVLFPGQLSGVGADGATLYPLSLSQGVRVSIRRKASTAATGKVLMSFYYN